MYCDLGKTNEAITLGSEASEICERVLGGSHVHTVQALRYFGVALLCNQRPGEAEPVLRRSLAAPPRQMKAWETAFTKGQLGLALLLLGRYDEAEPFLLEAHDGLLKNRDSIPPVDCHQVEANTESIVLLYRKWNRPDQVEKWETKLAK